MKELKVPTEAKGKLMTRFGINPEEVFVTLALIAWVATVIEYVAKRAYFTLLRKWGDEELARYVTRKVVHILAGGTVLVFPLVYRSVLIPLTLTLAVTIFLVKSRRERKLMKWFQSENNNYEVHFTLMASLVIAAGYLLGNPWYGVIPVSFMAIGDGVTGIVRGALLRRREKSWIGNLAMLLIDIPIGSIIGIPGIVAGVVAAIVEKFEFLGGKVDDNVTVPLTSFLVIVLFDRILRY